jgi:hypothetical protein
MLYFKRQGLSNEAINVNSSKVKTVATNLMYLGKQFLGSLVVRESNVRNHERPTPHSTNGKFSEFMS